MADPGEILGRRWAILIAAVALGLLPAGCQHRDERLVQGYVEGEYIYVSAAFAGTLESLKVQRGRQVHAGESLFSLDNTPQRAARDEAERRLAQARATLEDLKKGQRPTEIESLTAQLRQAESQLSLAERDLARQENLFEKRINTKEDVDKARTSYQQSGQRVAQLKADLETAQLGARRDQIDAAEANVRALEAELTTAQWNLAQMHQAAPLDGVVFDTLYREGEWVPAGRPVVALLPPAYIKVRAFVPQDQVSRFQPGQSLQVLVDGIAQPYSGQLSFISPQAEFTPPVIYSRESRNKLVFMIELRFDKETAAKLHPGQPVDVRW